MDESLRGERRGQDADLVPEIFRGEGDWGRDCEERFEENWCRRRMSSFSVECRLAKKRRGAMPFLVVAGGVGWQKVCWWGRSFGGEMP